MFREKGESVFSWAEWSISVVVRETLAGVVGSVVALETGLV